MTSPHRWLFVAGALVLLLGLLQKWFQQRWYLTEPLTAAALGVAVGPAGLHLLSLPPVADALGTLTQVSRVTLAVADMGVALRLPRGYPVTHWRSLAVVLGAGMVLMAAITGVLVWGLLGVSLWMAMLIGSAVASTDPVVATTIVTAPSHGTTSRSESATSSRPSQVPTTARCTRSCSSR